MTALRRRWFRFSLRTMLLAIPLAAVPLGWVGHQLHWIRERREFLRNIDRKVIFLAGCADPPWALSLFGEKYGAVLYTEIDESDPRIVRVRQLFPEWRPNKKPGAESGERSASPAGTR